MTRGYISSVTVLIKVRNPRHCLWGNSLKMFRLPVFRHRLHPFTQYRGYIRLLSKIEDSIKQYEKLPFLSANIESSIIKESQTWNLKPSAYEATGSLAFICRILPLLSVKALSGLYPILHDLLVKNLSNWNFESSSSIENTIRVRLTFYAARALRYLPLHIAESLESSFVRPSLVYHRSNLTEAHPGVYNSCMMAISQRFSDHLNPFESMKGDDVSEATTAFLEAMLVGIDNSWLEREQGSASSLPQYSAAFLGKDYAGAGADKLAIEWGMLDKLLIELASCDVGVSEITFPIFDRIVYTMRGANSKVFDKRKCWSPLATLAVSKCFLPLNSNLKKELERKENPLSHWSIDAETLIMGDAAQMGVFFSSNEEKDLIFDIVKSGKSLKQIWDSKDGLGLKVRKWAVPLVRRVAGKVPIRKVLEGVIDPKETEAELVEAASLEFLKNIINVVNSESSNSEGFASFYKKCFDRSETPEKILMEEEMRVRLRDLFLRKDGGRTLKNDDEYLDFISQLQLVNDSILQSSSNVSGVNGLLTHWGGKVKSIGDVVSLAERRRVEVSKFADAQSRYCGSVLVMPCKSRLFNEALDNLSGKMPIKIKTSNGHEKEIFISGYKNEAERIMHNRGTKRVEEAAEEDEKEEMNAEESLSVPQGWNPRSFQGLAVASKLKRSHGEGDSEEVDLVGRREFKFWGARAV
eukprot:GDKJ01056866.1.p1 GENE.GDKJ01056866.1~~GDKJ01056866.1.p1  ORF type:complete len:694 (-),score=111.39 GDKJ01056866.1:55-2136(-)